jgi:hypothetical protein
MKPHDRVGLGRRASAGALMTLAIVLASLAARASKVETWRDDSQGDFAKGHKERVVISDLGVVRLGRAVVPVAGGLEASRVWDLARTRDGDVYAATGDEGKVFRRARQGEWTVAFDSDDSQVFSLVATPDGKVYAGTGPSGQVIELTDPKHPATRPDPGVQYIWDLAVDDTGNLLAATGPNGQLWRRSGDGKWSLLLDGKPAHLLCVAVGPDGSTYAGSDGDGLIYRVGRDGKVAILYDAPQAEVRALLFAPDGALLAGTAAESGSASGRGPLRNLGSSADSGGGAPPRPIAPPNASTRTAQQKGTPPERPRSPEGSGGTSTPRPATAGENAVYRIGPDGDAREVLRARALIYALAWQDDRLLIGTGPEGQLYEVRGLGRESSAIARLDHGQILALLAEPDGDLLIGASDPGAVLRLESGHAREGSLTSDVHDAKLNARFGALTWRGDSPIGTSLAIQVRTGNVGEPDSTWSDWSAPLTTPGPSIPRVPPGRFAQYRVTFKASNVALSPELRSIRLHYQTINLAPEVTKINVPDLASGDGATRQTRLTLRWDANDPNGDDLAFTLQIRKDGWPDWVVLGEKPTTEKSFNWDSTAVPAGTYRLRVKASDRPSNGPNEAMTDTLVSEPFLVDHEAPTVTINVQEAEAKVTLQDGLTRLVKAEYALDGGDWTPIFPVDGLFDTPAESVRIDLSEVKGGSHVLMVRATDAAGNSGAGDAIFKAR